MLSMLRQNKGRKCRCTYLNYRDYVIGSILKHVHVNVEVVKLVRRSFLHHKIGPLAD